MPSRLDRREFFAAAAGAALAGCSETGPLTPRSPNVLFIFDDQLRADACSVYGGVNIATPNIDKLAYQGVRFTNAWSTYPLCTPYRGMLQTGRYPTQSGIFCNWTETHTGLNDHCLAHAFAGAGYQTGFIGKWHLAAGARKHEDLYVDPYNGDYAKRAADGDPFPNPEFVPPGPSRLGYQHWEAYNFHVAFNNYWFYRDEPEKIFSDSYETDTETDQAIAYMDKHKSDSQPFFLMVAPHPPHNPFNAEHNPPGYLEQIPEQLHYSPNVPEDHPRRTDPYEYRCYLSMCKNMDDNLGRILDYLDSSGLSDNTIVVFTADHGDQHGSHNRINKMAPYNESVNVPLIVRWPGRVPAGSIREEAFTGLDHFPTLCALAGVSSPDDLDGFDMSDAVLGGAAVDRPPALMMNYSSHWDYFQTQTLWPEWRAARDRQYSYIRWLSGEEELYDNAADPYQMRNLAKEDLPRMNAMREQLTGLLAEAHDEFLPGTAYAEWFNSERSLVRNAVGPVAR